MSGTVKNGGDTSERYRANVAHISSICLVSIWDVCSIVRISHSVGYCVYKMHSIFYLICSESSTISTKFHQALKLQIGF